VPEWIVLTSVSILGSSVVDVLVAPLVVVAVSSVCCSLRAVATE